MIDIAATFDKYEDESHKFERIPEAERLHSNSTLCGLLYFSKLLPDPSRIKLCAEHDEVWMYQSRSASGYTDKEYELTDADVLYLTRCGINWDNSNETLYFFT